MHVKVQVEVQVQYRRSPPETIPPGPCTVAAALGGCHGALGRSSGGRKEIQDSGGCRYMTGLDGKYRDLGGFREMPGFRSL